MQEPSNLSQRLETDSHDLDRVEVPLLEEHAVKSRLEPEPAIEAEHSQLTIKSIKDVPKGKAPKGNAPKGNAPKEELQERRERGAKESREHDNGEQE